MASIDAAGRAKTMTGIPKHLFAYIGPTTWTHQVPLLALTVVVFLIEVIPLELQRRIINDLVKHRPFQAIILLCGVYALVVLLQGSIKLGLNIYRSWVSERAKRDLREHIAAAMQARGDALDGDAQGTAVSMAVAEVEPIGNFVGSAISEPLLQLGILLTVIAYIFHLDLWMAVAALALFVPQLVFVPLMQEAMNLRTGARVRVMRRLGAAMLSGPATADQRIEERPIEKAFELDMGIFKIKFTMNFLMNLCSHFQVIAALLIGGWAVHTEQLEIGGVVAFISGVGRLNDPWGDLVNYFREISLTRVKYDMLAAAVNADPSL